MVNREREILEENRYFLLSSEKVVSFAVLRHVEKMMHEGSVKMCFCEPC